MKRRVFLFPWVTAPAIASSIVKPAATVLVLGPSEVASIGPGQTDYLLSRVPVLVFANGVHQEPGVDFEMQGLTLHFLRPVDQVPEGRLTAYSQP